VKLKTADNEWTVKGGLNQAMIEARGHTIEAREFCAVCGDDGGMITVFAYIMFTWIDGVGTETERPVLCQLHLCESGVVYRAHPVNVNQKELQL